MGFIGNLWDKIMLPRGFVLAEAIFWRELEARPDRIKHADLTLINTTDEEIKIRDIPIEECRQRLRHHLNMPECYREIRLQKYRFSGTNLITIKERLRKEPREYTGKSAVMRIADYKA